MKTYMETEIFEQSELLSKLENIDLTRLKLPAFSKIYIIASGSSKNAGDIAKYFLEDVLDVPVIVDFASEFAHKKSAIKKGDLAIFLSQSGETADSFKALESIKAKGISSLAITNKEGSKIATTADFHIYMNAGEEKSIAATKSLFAQLYILYKLGFELSQKENFKIDFELLKEKIEKTYGVHSKIKEIAQKTKEANSIIIIGRGCLSALSNEGSLKIQETTTIDTTAYPSGEFLHGHISVLNEKTPVISMIVGDKDSTNYQLALKNTLKIKETTDAPLIIIKNDQDKEIESLFSNSDFIEVPESQEYFLAFTVLVVLQLLALETSLALGKNPDTPKGLKKALTEE